VAEQTSRLLRTNRETPKSDNTRGQVRQKAGQRRRCVPGGQVFNLKDLKFSILLDERDDTSAICDERRVADRCDCRLRHS
jgi:hypothetical protein